MHSEYAHGRHREVEWETKGGKEERARREDHSLLGMPSSSSIIHINIFSFPCSFELKYYLSIVIVIQY
jgi:hypothetical protein